MTSVFSRQSIWQAKTLSVPCLIAWLAANAHSRGKQDIEHWTTVRHLCGRKGVTVAPVAVVRTTWLLILIPDCPFLFLCQPPPWWQDGKCASTMRCFGRSDPFCWYVTDVWLQNVNSNGCTRFALHWWVFFFCEADDFEKVMVTARNLSGCDIVGGEQTRLK